MATHFLFLKLLALRLLCQKKHYNFGWINLKLLRTYPPVFTHPLVYGTMSELTDTEPADQEKISVVHVYRITVRLGIIENRAKMFFCRGGCAI